MEDRTRVHVFVSGDVQGVGFAEAIKAKADEQSVVGWVKDTSDGRIEAVIEGPSGRGLPGGRALQSRSERGQGLGRPGRSRAPQEREVLQA